MKTEFSYRMLGISTPTYTLQPPDINIELAGFLKEVTPAERYRHGYQELSREQYRNCTKIFTDVSRRREGVGAAAVWSGGGKSASLPREATIFSAEAHAINNKIEVKERTHFVIMTDSRSVLSGLSDIRTSHPVCRATLHKINQLKDRNKHVRLCWVPSHVGIGGNEEADGAAEAAARRREEYIPVHYRDWYPHIRQVIIDKWNNQWQESRQKMCEVKEKVGEWKKIKVSRREEIVLNRLRSGHTCLTQGYLMEREGVQVPPICHYCNNALMTVETSTTGVPGSGGRTKTVQSVQRKRRCDYEDIVERKR